MRAGNLSDIRNDSSLRFRKDDLRTSLLRAIIIRRRHNLKIRKEKRKLSQLKTRRGRGRDNEERCLPKLQRAREKGNSKSDSYMQGRTYPPSWTSGISRQTDRENFLKARNNYSRPRGKTDKLEEPVNRELNVTRS